jgi:hypothetical protein
MTSLPERELVTAARQDVLRIDPLGSLPQAPDAQAEAPELLGLTQLLLAALAQMKRRAAAAEAEVERLIDRERELESRINERAAFDGTEHLQIGRMLAAAEARRIEQQARPLVSIKTVLLIASSAALATLATLIVLERLF